MAPKTKPAIDRIFAKVAVDEHGCWLWRGATIPSGYALVKLPSGEQPPVHRFVYEYFRGPIPEGLQIDHLCRVRHCCNPWHLEPVSARENVRRGVNARRGGSGSIAEDPCAVAALSAEPDPRYSKRTMYCPRGHAYSAENTRVTRDGQKHCRACARARGRAHTEKKHH